MLVAPHPEGHVVIRQPDHGRMCGQFARAWGNERFAPVAPPGDVRLAAEQHDDGWTAWERAPTLDPATGLPHTFRSAPYTLHLRIHAEWPPKLAERSTYAAYLVSLHHSAFFRPPLLAALRPGGRRIRAFLAQADAFRAGLRPRLAATDEELERNHRLVRLWDALSHDVILRQVPRTHAAVPAVRGSMADLVVKDGDGCFTVEPWPFAEERLDVVVPARILSGRYEDEGSLREALARARWVELRYRLVP